MAEQRPGDRSPLLHLAPRDAWHAAASAAHYVPEGYERDGFVHLSTPHQVLTPANALYRGRDDLVALVIDPTLLTAPLRWEPGSLGERELFPHLYGPLDVAAVVQVVAFPPGPDGGFTLPAALAR